jgi:ribonuclease D
MENRWVLVDCKKDLGVAEKAIKGAPILAVDTEYDSFRYFFEKLCLLQIYDGQTVWLIDPMADLDIRFLGEVFADAKILKVFHAGDNDIRLLKRDYAFSFQNIFDTYRAASLLGIHQLALFRLVESYLDAVLEKKMQRSRWDLRPLSEEQLHYAAMDTVYLEPLYQKLQAELIAKGLKRESGRIFDEMTGIVWRPKTFNPGGYRSLPGSGELAPDQRKRLRLLYRWRFEKAKETNIACFMILSGQQLVSLAGIEGATLTKLVGPGLLSPERAHRFGTEILRLLADKDSLLDGALIIA